MNLEQLLGGPTKTSVWDDFVPVIQEKNFTTIYLTDTIEAPSEYNKVCHLLNTASEAEHFYFIINTPGGYIDAAVMLVDAIKNSKAHTTAKVTGTVASAGTIITLACDDVEVAEHSSFMIHNYSGGIVGKGHEMKAHQSFVDKNLNESFKVFYEGFLTDKEMKEVIDGRDIWLNKNQVLARLASNESPTIDQDQPQPKRRGRPRKA